jgi:hypothetical protein
MYVPYCCELLLLTIEWESRWWVEGNGTVLSVGWECLKGSTRMTSRSAEFVPSRCRRSVTPMIDWANRLIDSEAPATVK